MPRRFAPVLALLLTVGVVACGDDPEPVNKAEPFECAAAQAAAKKKEKTAMSTDSGDVLDEVEERGKPEVTTPEEPVDELCSIDDIIGNGTEVKAGDTVTVHYVGVGQQSKSEFDSSWSRNEPISFGLNQVIKGWSDGLVGMKVGGRRTLVIPGEMAYGPNGFPPDIGPNETLVFTIDLIAIG